MDFLKILTGSVYHEPLLDAPVEPLYIEMMIEFYVEVFGGFMRDIIRKWREFNLAELHVFRSILNVYRPFNLG